MSIAVLVLTHGRRDTIEPTIASAVDNLKGHIVERYIHDDSGDPDYRAWLTEQFPGHRIIGGPDRLGFGSAIRNSWAVLADRWPSYIFHLEDDFTFNRVVDLDAICRVMDCHPYLVQMALRRQAWNAEEIAAGGVIERFLDEFAERSDGHDVWLEHRKWWTTNPSIYRRDLCRRPWPRGARSEGQFTHQLLCSPKLRFGYWGGLSSGEAVTHIGTTRAGGIDY